MGYNIDSFFKLFDGLPRFPVGTGGQAVYEHYENVESERLPVEAFFGLKIESTLTKICPRQTEYMILYRQYKEIAVIAQKLYESEAFTKRP